MTARIAGFVSRADAGLRGPKSVSKNITPDKGGVAPHYGGPKQPAAEPGSDHAKCVSTWKAWQNYHMNTHGWTDIAYTGGFCNHGFAFAGRGVGVRTAANGTNAGNQSYYAVVWIGGEGQTPTQEALDAADWWVEQLRKSGAGRNVKPHRFFKSTGCPGDPLVGFAASRDGKDVPTSSTPPPPPAPTSSKPSSVDRELTKRIQRAVSVPDDGLWGNQTDIRAVRMRSASQSKLGWPVHTNGAFNVEDVQKVIGTKVDGDWGTKSQAALARWLVKFQTVLGVSTDGRWGPRTDARFMQVRNDNLKKF